MSPPMNGTEGQDRESYIPGPDETEPEEAALSDGPVGSYEWHKAVFFWGGDPTEEEEDAFRSGWLRAIGEAEKRFKEMTGVEIDLNLDPKEAGS